jgi:hypothetical protein
MSELLLIVDPSWTEVPNAYEEFQKSGLDLGGVQELIQGLDWLNISQALENSGHIGNNVIISDARAVGSATTAFQFFYKL